MSAPLAPAPSNIQSLMPVHEGNNLANLCRQIVLSAVVDIQGKSFLKVEGWESIAAADHCTPEIVKVECVSVMKFGQEVQGVRAEAILKRDSDGYIISRGFGFVGEDEYGDPSEVDYYAMEAKSQTRAVSRVCRHKYAFVLLLIDKNIQTTPADEVPPGGFPSSNPPSARTGRVWKPRQSAPLPPQAASAQSRRPQNQPAQTRTQTTAQTATAQPGVWDGTIKSVNIKEGVKQTGTQAGQPYILYILKMEDGREAVTFDDKLGETLGRAVGYQCSLQVNSARNRPGKFVVVQLLPARNHQEETNPFPPDDDDEYNE